MAVDGEIDRSNAQQVAAALLKAVPNVAAAVVLDLTGTGYIDSSGIQLLFEVAERLRKRQQQLRAVVPDGAQIRRVLSVVALDRTVPLHPTLDEALGATRPAADPSS
ncbi:MAG: STAS domain-containing protein [Actinomycetota bacterium]|nr:STAS domain-containing protein [Actinomycetota bacterium]